MATGYDNKTDITSTVPVGSNGTEIVSSNGTETVSKKITMGFFRFNRLKKN